jgi:hypothetical protein
MTRVNIELPEELHKKIKVLCAMEGNTIRELVEEALDREVNGAKGLVKKK